MRKFIAVAITAGLWLGPVKGFAHGQPPAATHGGFVHEAHEKWVELVVQTNRVSVYVLDEAKKPVPVSQVTGTVTLMIGGKLYKVGMYAAGDDGLVGQIPVPAAGKMLATVSLKVTNQPISARFNLGS